METDWVTFSATVIGIIVTFLQTVGYVLFKRITKSSCCIGTVEMSGEVDTLDKSQVISQLAKQLEELTILIKTPNKKE